MLCLWGCLDMDESSSELSLVLWYQGGLVLRGRKGSGCKGPLLFSMCVWGYGTWLSLCHGESEQ